MNLTQLPRIADPELHARTAAAIRDGVRLRLSPGAHEDLVDGRKVMLNGGEADDAADAALLAARQQIERMVREQIAVEIEAAPALTNAEMADLGDCPECELCERCGEVWRRYATRVARGPQDAPTAPAPYPRTEGDTIVLGPEIFADPDGDVICWKGENYVRQAPTAPAQPATDTTRDTEATGGATSPTDDLSAVEEEVRTALLDVMGPGTPGLIGELADAVMDVIRPELERLERHRHQAENRAQLARELCATEHERAEKAEKAFHQLKTVLTQVRTELASARRCRDALDPIERQDRCAMCGSDHVGAIAEALEPAQDGPGCSCDGDPLECTHEAARGQAEATIERIRVLAEQWSSLAPADDWGDATADTLTADLGRTILAVLDRTPPDEPGPDLPCTGEPGQPAVDELGALCRELTARINRVLPRGVKAIAHAVLPCVALWQGRAEQAEREAKLSALQATSAARSARSYQLHADRLSTAWWSARIGRARARAAAQAWQDNCLVIGGEREQAKAALRAATKAIRNAEAELRSDDPGAAWEKIGDWHRAHGDTGDGYEDCAHCDSILTGQGAYWLDPAGGSQAVPAAEQPAPDDLDQFIAEQSADPDFATAYLRAQIRSAKAQGVLNQELLQELLGTDARISVTQDEKRVWCASARIAPGIGAHGDGASPAEAIADLDSALSALAGEEEGARPDRKRRRELLAALTQEAVEAGSYGEPAPQEEQ